MPNKLGPPDVEDVLIRVRLYGKFMTVYGDEGPRDLGHCVYCASQCVGITQDCEPRVIRDSANPNKIERP